MPKKQDTNYEMAELFLNMYMGCMKFKTETKDINKKDRIDCSEIYKKYEFYAGKYIDSKEENKKT